MVVSSWGDEIRICLDPEDLNKAIKPEHYPIPAVEEISAKIPDAKVFTVLDAKRGYLQMKLDYKFSLLTTMNTPKGWYRWLKLPFGIKSAPEMYQRTMNEMLEGINHAYAIMDDILITGHNLAHHDLVLEAKLQRAKSYNLRLNFDKVKVWSPICGPHYLSRRTQTWPRKSESHEGYATSRNKRGCTPVPGIHTIFVQVPPSACRSWNPVARAH